MENVPERVGVDAHLRASDEDRERVVQVLGDALTAGRLSADEHSERLDAVYAAKTLGELEPITYDLPATSAPGYIPSARASTVAMDTVGASAESDNLVAIFSGSVRKGRWRVRSRINATAIFGGVEVDMTDAVFEAPVIEVKVFAMFGGMEIRVPEGVEVRNRGVGIFGGFDIEDSGVHQPGAPVVVIKGLALFGGVGARARKRRA
ncbi:DUF1707 SHOCT-like domain-containing protein [Bailinhaonella thermotolerans]|uniref:DUF1707 and DUF2154 domain-containing protein n=1 Tax=Bailinhaonella thermotolerans TaxID=1070861 RepID=A0A3A4AMN1_9ACTN|nr:DUF1707 domain-containing protein [Bailinhaonella thermotolerans]RJL22493.1 DUF1707 and DUF2154 domain-containing protein [Bailinhaonella thermotolerans]